MDGSNPANLRPRRLRAAARGRRGAVVYNVICTAARLAQGPPARQQRPSRARLPTVLYSTLARMIQYVVCRFSTVFVFARLALQWLGFWLLRKLRASKRGVLEIASVSPCGFALPRGRESMCRLKQRSLWKTSHTLMASTMYT